MQIVKISVTDIKNGAEKPVEIRFVEVESDRRLTGAMARRILRRQFPEMSSVFALLKTETGWSAQRALKATEQCEYHYVWRHYALTPA